MRVIIRLGHPGRITGFYLQLRRQDRHERVVEVYPLGFNGQHRTMTTTTRLRTSCALLRWSRAHDVAVGALRFAPCSRAKWISVPVTTSSAVALAHVGRCGSHAAMLTALTETGRLIVNCVRSWRASAGEAERLNLT
ncbi:hypothetical protein PINS_up004292 [Pythium insidiosum]|nr:hypothetical protein PINS_up004292 [Pythium insidiosum]